MYYMGRIIFKIEDFDLRNSGKLTPIFVFLDFKVVTKTDSQTHDKAIFDRKAISNAVKILMEI